jgi:hypothetical protein
VTTAAAQAIITGAGLVVVAQYVLHNDFGFFDFGNNEFLNYSQLAAHSMGLQHSTLPVPWETFHQSLRDGTDFINSTVSMLTGRHPVYVVQLSAALLRSAYLAAVCAIIISILSDIPVLAIYACGIAALSAFDLLQFTQSFMGASLSMSIAVLLVAVTINPSLNRQVAITAYVLLNLALLVSYPEAMIVLKFLEGCYVVEALFRKCRETVLRSGLGNLLVALINPWLVISKAKYALSTIGSEGGWHFLANKVVSYASRLAGTEPINLSFLSIGNNYYVIANATLLAICAAALSIYICRRMRSVVPLVIIAIIISMHLLFYFGLRPHLYAAVKIMMAWWWLLPVGLAFVLKGGYRLLPIAVSLLLILPNVETMRREIKYQASLPRFFSETETTQVLNAIKADGRELDLISEDTMAIWFWLQVCDSNEISVRMTENQRLTWMRTPGNISSDLVPQGGVQLRPLSYLNFSRKVIDLELETVDSRTSDRILLKTERVLITTTP